MTTIAALLPKYELEINAANYIDFVCEAGAKEAQHFGGKTKAGMRVTLSADEMPFAESSLTRIPGRIAANQGRLYQITDEQAAALCAALAAKVENLETWSTDYLADSKPINTPRAP